MQKQYEMSKEIAANVTRRIASDIGSVYGNPDWDLGTFLISGVPLCKGNSIVMFTYRNRELIVSHDENSFTGDVWFFREIEKRMDNYLSELVVYAEAI